MTIFRKIVHLLRSWRIYVGRDPQRISVPGLVLFPLQPATLCCGLAGILVLRRKSKPVPAGDGLADLFGAAAGNNLTLLLTGVAASSAYLGGAASREAMEGELLRLKGEEAFQRIFFDPEEALRLTRLSERMQVFLAAEEALLEEKAGCFSTADLEAVNGGLVLLRDLVWGLKHDILDNVEKIVHLAGGGRSGDVAPEALSKYRKINTLLNSLDRLEVRGRDSAGISVSFVPADPGAFGELLVRLRGGELAAELYRRMAAGDLVDGSITAPRGGILPGEEGIRTITFTYKTASIIGALGRNVRELRNRIARDSLFHAFARLPAAFETAFAHTRWASVGSITEENCHPVGNFTVSAEGLPGGAYEKDYPAYGRGPWSIQVVLNGDIDNYQPLREVLGAGGELIAPEVTTDTKIIPLAVEKYLLEGFDLKESFRRAVGDFEGSHAIALVSNAEPGRVYLALRGSGQTIYVGITPDRYLFSSELYGLVEETPYFVKMDGEKPSRRDPAEAATGQIFILSQDTPGGIAGIEGFFYDGTPIALGPEALRKAEITTRDIDRGDYPHFFLKEISEAALSVRKTLRGKYRFEGRGDGERALFNLGEDIVPARIAAALLAGALRRIVVIGHGTAAVAGGAVADILDASLRGSGIRVEAKIASELSGFCLHDDLGDTLVIPITQSGTTTDTNRAVAMAVERGAAVIAIVNRRQSDITTKADGVFYTSDGRDIEMSVASTKAFYSQIVAGNILALYLARLLKTLPDRRIVQELRVLETAPALMSLILGRKEILRLAAEKLVKRKRYWAVVGSGPNKTAAEEVRIKLSELCYKTISFDVVENKKHIDLSAEPLILVCAAGSPDAVVGDIAKDVAIFKAHKSAVIVFADEGEERFDAIADAVVPIPRAPYPLPVILNTVAGHLFGYFAARSIDADALFFREFKSRLNLVMVEQAKQGLSLYEGVADGRLHRIVGDFTDLFQKRRSGGDFSQTGADTISDLTLLLKYAAGKLPLDDFRHDFPGAETASPIDLLDVTLGRAVDELSRPIDAIRHQAKTVTVGTSRKETPLKGVLFDLMAELAFSAEALLSANVLAVSRLQGAISAINGYTLYALDRFDADGKPSEETTIMIVKRAGVSLAMPSRAERPGLLMGTKKGIAASGRIYVGQGRSDAAPLVILPLLGEGGGVRRLLLAHVTFNEALSIRERKEILGERVNDIRNLIQECNLPWEDGCLGEIPLGLLLGEPVEVVAGMIRERLELQGARK